MILGIDASNISSGGGVTHLSEFLRVSDPEKFGFSDVVVWSGSRTLLKIPDRPWLQKVHDPLLERGCFSRAYWQRFKLASLARAAKCNLIFAVGGSVTCRYRPVVTMSRNLLPFEWQALRLYGFSWRLFRLFVLRTVQKHSFRKADGLIFLSVYAKSVIMGVVRKIEGESTIICHGIEPIFFHAPRTQLEMSCYSPAHPLRLLYVSDVNIYKHHKQVVQAVAILWAKGIPVVLDIVGDGPILKQVKKFVQKVPGGNRLAHCYGAVSHDALSDYYQKADLKIFASSCENLPNILLEAMASGLPIACSNRGPMPEVLGDAGLYFDPQDPEEIARVLEKMIISPSLRAEKADAAFHRALGYSWERCAEETFEFLAGIASRSECHRDGSRV